MDKREVWVSVARKRGEWDERDRGEWGERVRVGRER